MTQQSAQRVLIALILAAGVAVAALFVVDGMRQRQRSDAEPFRGGSGNGAQQTLEPRELREFNLIDQQGQPFASKEMKGKVWVVSFFFTKCPTVCPQVLAQTAEMQKRLSTTPQWKDIRFVSITVDPQHDTPAVLDERAKLWNADPKHWIFLTGSKDAIWSLTSARDGFQLAVGDGVPGDKMSIAHSSRFVLINQQHQVVGYFDALDEAKREELVGEMMRLLQ